MTAGKQCTITDLRIYPIKSCRGISVKSTTLTRQGLQHDRKWMFVDSSDKFITIRQNSSMTLINTSINEDMQLLEITFPDVSGAGFESKTISIPLNPDDEYLTEHCEKINVEIWSNQTDAWTWNGTKSSTSQDITDTIRRYFQAIEPDSNVKLVMKGPTARPVGGNGSVEILGRHESVNFPDVLPILVASEVSLRELNQRLKEQGEEEISIERFRPNIVVDNDSNPDHNIQDNKSNDNSNDSNNNSNDDGNADSKKELHAWEEDNWRTLRINPSTNTTINKLTSLTSLPSTILPKIGLPSSIDLDVSARCARCQVPNVNPDTGHKKSQPWDTLVSYRRVDEGIKYKPCFGMLCCPRSNGQVGVGMKLHVVEVMPDGEEHRYIKGF